MEAPTPTALMLLFSWKKLVEIFFSLGGIFYICTIKTNRYDNNRIQ